MGRGHYRHDIEGLRAVAVVGVVLFHAGVRPIAGGFLGVDVFFVISGFLITGLVARELEEGRFSLAAFYRRRVARIVPALLLTVLAVLAAALLLCFPGEMRALRGAAVSAALFASNLYFWRRDSYFAPPSDVQPLIHTWSLGVEEQFYLVYPLLLLVAARGGRGGMIAAVAAATVASLAAAAWLGVENPQAAFYLLPTRLWELGLGGLAAFRLLPVPVRRGLREGLSAAAAVVLLVALVATPPGPGTPFPKALAACAATILLLAFADGTLVGGFLAVPPLRGLGRISYAFYLWHWPVLAFWRLTVGVDLNVAAQAVLMAASLALALLSYVLVEHPLRRRLRDAPPFPVIAGGAAAALIVAALAWAATGGALQLRRIPPPVAATLAAENERIRAPIDGLDPGCRLDPVRTTATCLHVSPGRRNVLLAGDSHAAHLWSALVARFPQIHFLVSIEQHCRGSGADADRPVQCPSRALAALAPARGLGIDGVLLAARWRPDSLPALREEIRALRAAGRDVTVVGPVVEYLPSVPRLLARAQLSGDRRLYDAARTRARETLDGDMERLVRAAGGTYFSAYRAECPAPQPCRLFTRTGRPFHFDYGHYTADGAREIVSTMAAP
jgi:peptidoglycan/LPS O-acetylase OafA/YrhL